VTLELSEAPGVGLEPTTKGLTVRFKHTSRISDEGGFRRFLCGTGLLRLRQFPLSITISQRIAPYSRPRCRYSSPEFTPLFAVRCSLKCLIVGRGLSLPHHRNPDSRRRFPAWYYRRGVHVACLIVGRDRSNPDLLTASQIYPTTRWSTTPHQHTPFA
jgi:hypothetical protein